MSDLKPCMFCGGDARLVKRDGASLVYCTKCERGTGLCCGDAAVTMWNTRPAEDALKSEVEELRYIVEQFSKWTAEGGCAKANHPDFPCWWERNRVELELDDYCDSDDEIKHKCWVEYYRWEYRQKLNSATPEKGGEDE